MLRSQKTQLRIILRWYDYDLIQATVMKQAVGHQQKMHEQLDVDALDEMRS